MLAPIIEELANDYEGRVVVCKMDVDENTDIAKKYKVMSIPTVLIFKNGEEVSRDVGVKAKNVYEEKLNEIL
jgi:thioredoxin 1